MSNMLEEYNALVRSNPEQVKRFESIGRMVAMFLPVRRFGKFSDVLQESSYSVLGLVSLYHDRIIHGMLLKQSNLMDQNGPTKLIRLFLTLFAHTEVVMEMLARIFGGEERRMQLIYLIECVKALGRFILLAKTRAGQVLITGGQYEAKRALENEEEGPKISEVPDLENPQQDGGRRLGSGEDEEGEVAQQHPPQAPPRWAGRRTGKQLVLPESLKTLDNVTTKDAEENKTDKKSSSSNQAATQEVQALDAGPEDVVLRMTGEVLHIVRPVIYVAHLRRLGSKNNKSWSPWILSLILEILSVRCSSVASPYTGNENNQSNKVYTTEEVLTRAVKKVIYGRASATGNQSTDEELARRKQLFALYLMRTPLFDKLTLPFVQRIGGGFSHLPGIGPSIESLMTDSLVYYHRNHFYVSGS